MDDISRRKAVKAVGVTIGSFSAYKVKSFVSFKADAKLATRAAAGDNSVSWHPLDLGTSHYLMMPILANGQLLNALVDTGASRSVINENVAKRMKLPDQGAVIATAFTKEVSGRLYGLADLSIGPIRLNGLVVASYPSKAIEDTIEGTFDFILGRDVLQHGVLEVDFPLDRVRLAATRSLDVEAVPITLTGGISNLVSVSVQVEENEDLLAIVDLGSALPISISSRQAEKWGLLQGRRNSTTMTVGIEGAEESLMVTLAEVRLADFVLTNVPACVVNDWKLSRDINIGWPLLASFECSFEFGAHKLWLKQNQQAAAKEIPRDRSGIGASRLADRIVIRHIARNSPAEDAGLKYGDEIVRIDDKSVSALYPRRGERFGTLPAGTTIGLGLKDGRSVSITLNDYF